MPKHICKAMSLSLATKSILLYKQNRSRNQNRTQNYLQNRKLNGARVLSAIKNHIGSETVAQLNDGLTTELMPFVIMFKR